jgi:hypothetical protein
MAAPVKFQAFKPISKKVDLIDLNLGERFQAV